MLSGKIDVEDDAERIGPVIIFKRFWQELGLADIVKKLLADRKFEFDVERAIFLTFLPR